MNTYYRARKARDPMGRVAVVFGLVTTAIVAYAAGALLPNDTPESCIEVTKRADQLLVLATDGAVIVQDGYQDFIENGFDATYIDLAHQELDNQGPEIRRVRAAYDLAVASCKAGN